MRIAALDLGSNSFHLIVVDAEAAGDRVQMRLVARAKETVRLGESTLLTGVIPTDGFERGVDALAKLRQVAAMYQPQAFLVAATSAIREASNGDAFVRAAQELTGGAVRVIDGHEEARLVYFGMRSALSLGDRRLALFDLGGGSLELIVADAHQILMTESMKLGVLRLKDQWLAREHAGVVAATTLEKMRSAVRATLEPAIAAAQARGFDFVAFTAGTARTLRAMAYAGTGARGGELPATLSLAALVKLEAQLASLPAAARAGLPGMDVRRVDTLLPGTVVLRTALELCGASEATYCDAALREAMVAAYMAGSWG